MIESTPSKRAAGVLFHPTSLPGPHGIGALGKAAFDWVDFLVASGQKWWQILPLGPTGYGDSPYHCFSALAGNPYRVDLGAVRAPRIMSQLYRAILELLVGRGFAAPRAPVRLNKMARILILLRYAFI